MNLDELRAFVGVAEAGGFSAAAIRMSSSQPTLSRQVKNLETHLGGRLFERLGRSVVLTDLGYEVLDRSNKLLDEADSLRDLAHSDSQLRGRLTIGAAESVVLERVPKLLSQFLKSHPSVQVTVRTASSTRIIEYVRDGSVDVGICMLPDEHPSLHLVKLWEDRLIPLVPPKHSLANHRISLEEFVAERQLVIRPELMAYGRIESAFRAGGHPLVPDMTFGSFSQMVEFISVGLGVGLVSSWSAEKALKRNQVAAVTIKGLGPMKRALGIALHLDRVLDGPLQALVELAESKA